MIGRGLKIVFVGSIVAAIAITLVGGYFTFEAAPPYSGKVVAEGTGELLFDKEDILAGQAVWQKYGLMDLGSVWGHGTDRGTEFTADTLHRIGQHMRDHHARQQASSDYAGLSDPQKRETDYQVIEELRQNRYDESTDTLTLTAAQVSAWKLLREHYDKAFDEGVPDANIRPRHIPDTPCLHRRTSIILSGVLSAEDIPKTPRGGLAHEAGLVDVATTPVSLNTA